MTPTVGDIIDAFSDYLESAAEDLVDPTPDVLYIDILNRELEIIQLSYSDSGFSEEDKLRAACQRIPGLLHLYKIY